MTGIAKKDAAAIAGWSMNAHVPVSKRLDASRRVLDFYVDQQQQLLDLLEYLDAESKNPEYVSTPREEALNDAVRRLRAILEDED